MTTETQEYLEKLRNKEVNTTSKLNLRNESKQGQQGVASFQFLKKEKNKIAKLLIPTDFFLPFDPFTGEETDEYNQETKFRVEQSFDTIVKALKTFYESEEGKEVKEKFLKKARIKEWDTSKTDEITPEDLAVLDKFRPVRIFTERVLHVNSKLFTGSDYGRDYRVTFTRNEMGEVVPKEPLEEGKKFEFPQILKLQGLFSLINMERYAAWERDNIGATKDKKEEERKTMMRSTPITKDYNANFLMLNEFPMEKLKIKDLNKYDAQEIFKTTRVTKMSENIETAIKNQLTTYKESRDIYPAFLEFDMIVPDEDKDSDRGKNTKFNTSEIPIDKYADFKEFYNFYCKYIDDLKDQETSVMKSAIKYIIDDSSINQLLACTAEEYPFDYVCKYLTKEAFDRYPDLITGIWGDSADDLFAKHDRDKISGSSVSEETKKLAEQDLEKIANEINANTDTEMEIEE